MHFNGTLILLYFIEMLPRTVSNMTYIFKWQLFYSFSYNGLPCLIVDIASAYFTQMYTDTRAKHTEIINVSVTYILKLIIIFHFATV